MLLPLYKTIDLPLYTPSTARAALHSTEVQVDGRSFGIRFCSSPCFLTELLEVDVLQLLRLYLPLNVDVDSELGRHLTRSPGYLERVSEAISDLSEGMSGSAIWGWGGSKHVAYRIGASEELLS